MSKLTENEICYVDGEQEAVYVTSLGGGYHVVSLVEEYETVNGTERHDTEPTVVRNVSPAPTSTRMAERVAEQRVESLKIAEEIRGLNASKRAAESELAETLERVRLRLPALQWVERIIAGSVTHVVDARGKTHEWSKWSSYQETDHWGKLKARRDRTITFSANADGDWSMHRSQYQDSSGNWLQFWPCESIGQALSWVAKMADDSVGNPDAVMRMARHNPDAPFSDAVRAVIEEQQAKALTSKRKAIQARLDAAQADMAKLDGAA